MTVGGEEALDAAGDVADFAGGHDFFFFAFFAFPRELRCVVTCTSPLIILPPSSKNIWFFSLS